MVVATQQSSAKYDFQVESYDMMISYTTTDVVLLYHTWKACICFFCLHFNINSVFSLSMLFPC